MSDAWDGRPENPERRSVHAIAVGDDVWLSQWEPKEELWDFGNTGALIHAADFGVHCAAEGYRYLGPCLTPAEVEARVAAARREALEEAAKIALRIPVPEDAGPIDGHARVMASVQIAFDIRALKGSER